MVFVYERAYVPHAIMHHCNSKTKANHQKNECETIYAKDWPNERFDHVFHANIYSPAKERARAFHLQSILLIFVIYSLL